MIFSNNRHAYRQAFYHAWQKHLKKMPLEPFETQIVQVLKKHPEYHAFFERPTLNQAQEFEMEENPFLHMSLHLALFEQISLNRPTGIASIYQHLLLKHEDAHFVEHAMMDTLAKLLFESQQTGIMAKEELYLAELKKI